KCIGYGGEGGGNLPARAHVQANLAELFRGHHLQRHHHSGHQWPPHVSDLVSDDGAAQGRKARFAPRDYRSDRDERFFKCNGAVEDRGGEQDSGVSERYEVIPLYYDCHLEGGRQRDLTTAWKISDVCKIAK